MTSRALSSILSEQRALQIKNGIEVGLRLQIEDSTDLCCRGALMYFEKNEDLTFEDSSLGQCRRMRLGIKLL
jgi:hypothetical protein